MDTSPFALNPQLDPDALHAAYRRDGRVRIAGLLAGDGAGRLRAALEARDDWRQLLNSGERLYELDRATRAAMPEPHRRALDTAVAEGARHGFQFRYESIRVPDEQAARRASVDLLARFAQWLSEPVALDFLRRVVGAADVRFADAQATAYAPGDFLTAHDDAVAGKDRRAAYVLSLNPQWRAEWGGLLLFHRPDGTVEGLVPAFNTLDLLAVPQPHSVSFVTPAAIGRRLSITGWLRAQPQPA